MTRGLTPRVPRRDSGIPWLGEIPAHWAVTRLKFVAEVHGGLTLGKNYGTAALVEYPYLRVANVQDGYLDLSDVATILIPETEAEACLLQAGDVLMNEGGDADKLGRGCIWAGEIAPCLHQNHVFAVRPQLVCSEWLNAWTSTEAAKAFFESRAKQSTNLASISATNLKELPIPVPPADEQRAIAAYLACETERLDGLVAAKERVLGLVAEKRRALITRAVTRGLDPCAPSRDSGIPWLGEIPAHWSATPLKRSATIIDCKHRTVPFTSEGIPLASIREVQSWEVDLTAAKMTTKEEYLLMIEGGREPRPGDVIVSRNATVGAAALVPPGRAQFCMGQDVSLVRPGAELEPAFLNWLFRSDCVANQFTSTSIGAIFFRINVEQIKELLIPLPPLDEQRAIVAHIAAETAKLDALRAAMERTIALLKERRAALIAAAVTGRIPISLAHCCRTCIG